MTDGSGRFTGPPFVGALVWLLPAVTLYWVLAGTGVGDGHILRYSAYFTGCVVLPGVLLLRAFAPGRRTWPEDVGIGIVVGLSYELPGWALFTAVGMQQWLVVWPAAVLVVFAAVPRLRRHWRAQNAPRLPLAWGATLSLLMSATLLMYYGSSVSASPVPKYGGNYYQDMLWHLSIVYELGRSVPPQIPQVAGETMQYHWFADAHLASAAQIAGIDPRFVLFRLWFAPIIIGLVLAVAALARQVSGAWWTAPLAVALTVVVQRVAIWEYVGGVGGSPLVFLSPSQSFGTTVSVGAAALLIGALYRGAPRRSWVLVLLVVCVAAGSKPTAVPLLLGGTGLAALFLLARNRRIPWPAVGFGVALVGVMVASMLTVAGSTAGTPLRLFGFLRAVPGYTALTGDTAVPAPGGWIIAGLRDADQQTLTWAIAILVSVVVSRAVVAVSFLGLAQRRTRTDPAQWWLVGALIASMLGFLVVDHPSLGQYYFLGGALPFAGVAAGYVVHGAVTGRRRVARRVIIAGGLLAGAALALAILAFGNSEARPVSPAEITRAVTVPMLLLAAALAVGLLGWLVLRAVRPQVRGLGLALLMCVAVGLALPSRPWSEWRNAADALTGEPRQIPAVPLFTTDEIQAALWLERNAGRYDVVVTNTACLSRQQPRPACDARGYLVSGVGGHRTLMEGWAYTQQSLANQGEGNVGSSLLPSPWPDRVELTRKALTAPTPDLLETLRRDHGVRWVFADKRAHRVVAERTLDRLADRRYTRGQVIVYELRD
ncbi:hypothetical protein EV643_104376 [Kribbella sp. VKM Ac-2527]|uniref:4-amino-4-deoxy-L-arabinose transferase-like glycosyltransferase n=1 Tax=Kribbella caucasensis TaxID=2512215 RepID=A0A4R6KM43_9ACTN|nr:hypothetical protein [Kribbella sp. VKM Ac-2527]TDO50876.1 hypothetical protein EV643_104376 [Kribbella sp. VKM Ac-2527]